MILFVEDKAEQLDSYVLFQTVEAPAEEVNASEEEPF